LAMLPTKPRKSLQEQGILYQVRVTGGSNKQANVPKQQLQ